MNGPRARRLYTQHVDRVFRTVRGMLRSDADAEDVTQDAMLTVLTSLNTYTPRPDARFAARVATIAVLFPEGIQEFGYADSLSANASEDGAGVKLERLPRLSELEDLLDRVRTVPDICLTRAEACRDVFNRL